MLYSDLLTNSKWLRMFEGFGVIDKKWQTLNSIAAGWTRNTDDVFFTPKSAVIVSCLGNQKSSKQLYWNIHLNFHDFSKNCGCAWVAYFIVFFSRTSENLAHLMLSYSKKVPNMLTSSEDWKLQVWIDHLILYLSDILSQTTF